MKEIQKHSNTLKDFPEGVFGLHVTSNLSTTTTTTSKNCIIEQPGHKMIKKLVYVSGSQSDDQDPLRITM